MTGCHQKWNAERALATIRGLADVPGALLPVLHALHTDYGHVPDEAVPLIARSLRLSEAEVHGVISFYHDFRRTPPPAHTIRVCRAEACQSMGCEAVFQHLDGSTGPDLAVETVYCLGNCALAPAAMVDSDLVGRFSIAKADRALAELGARP